MTGVKTKLLQKINVKNFEFRMNMGFPRTKKKPKQINIIVSF